MKQFLVLVIAMLSLPLPASAAYVSGVDDTAGGRTPIITPDVQKPLDDAILTYYQVPSKEKVDLILDIMTQSQVLERKTAWPTLVGFLTVVFPANKNHVMSWMSRNDYNTYAQYVIVDALIHAHMRESALLFAKAHAWDAEDIYRLREMPDMVDLKHLTIVVPGHIDTLWGAFFGSGDLIYVDQIIDHMLNGKLPAYAAQAFMISPGDDALGENKMLAATTLRDYARDHKLVRDDLEKRYEAEPEGSPKKQLFKEILGK